MIMEIKTCIFLSLSCPPRPKLKKMFVCCYLPMQQFNLLSKIMVSVLGLFLLLIFFVINCFISETTSYNIYKRNTFYNTQVHVYLSHTTKYESLGITL